jgi:hypothetical protein
MISVAARAGDTRTAAASAASCKNLEVNFTDETLWSAATDQSNRSPGILIKTPRRRFQSAGPVAAHNERYPAMPAG